MDYYYHFILYVTPSDPFLLFTFVLIEGKGGIQGLIYNLKTHRQKKKYPGLQQKMMARQQQIEQLKCYI